MASNVPVFNITPKKMDGFRESMGYEGIGVFHLEDAMSDEFLTEIQGEILDPELVAWRDGTDEFTNARGVLVQQVFEAYALKLRIGDLTKVQKVPVITSFVTAVELLVRNDLAVDYPSLADWEADEAVLQRYLQGTGKLTSHKDNARHTGVVIIGVVEGEGKLTAESNGKTKELDTKLGSLVVVRASGLLSVEEDLRPEHAVSAVTTSHRTSLTTRSNNRPLEGIPGFTYDNWRS
jgi:hypothetical protein